MMNLFSCLGPLIRFPGAQGANQSLTSNIQNPAFFRPTCEQWSLPENNARKNLHRRRSINENEDSMIGKALLTRTGIYHLLEHRLVS